MNKVNLHKISLLLLLVLIPFFANAKEGISTLYKNAEWLDLLHYERGKSVVDSPSPFFLSKNGYKDPKAEFDATFQAFSKGNREAICNFPARLEFIEKNTSKKFRHYKCPGYEEFKQKAPLDNLYLVFAGENNGSPTSVMGHIFLKISGTRKGELKEHAFSYFATNFDDKSLSSYVNVVFSSVDGIYALTPYKSKRNNYLFYEQRPIWEVELKFSKEKKAYLHKHMWELKEKNVRYSFIFHNCGTGAVNLLRLVYGNLPMYKVFPTPIDYIKKFEQDGRIDDVDLIASPEYNLKMIRDNYDLLDIYMVRTGGWKFDDKQKHLANQLHNYHESMGMIDNPVYKIGKVKLREETKDLLDAKPSSRIYVGYKNQNKNALEVNFMPLYQDFYDVSKAYFDDIETKIAAINMVYDDKFYINRFDILSIRSIIDSSMAWNMYSKYFSARFENARNVDGFRLKPVLEGGAGYAVSVYDEMFKPYFMPKIGYRYDHVNNFYAVPEVGIIIKPIDDVKIVISYEKYFDSRRDNRGFNEKLGISASYQLPKNFTFNVKYDKYDDEELSIGLGLNF